MTNRDKVFIEISKGTAFADIATSLQLGYTTVLKYKKEYDIAEKEGKLDLILSQDLKLIEHISGELPEDASEFMDKIKGLDRLNVNMQMSAELILVKLKTVIANVGPDDVVDLMSCTKLLCDLQNAFFNKNSVNVNVQNNNFDSGESGYKEYLSDKPTIDNPGAV
jgi:hypothetical protein